MADEESEWRFGIDDVGPDAEDGPDEADEDDEPKGSVAGNMDYEMPVEPEAVSPESALFVLLGVTVTLLVFARFVVG
jgi:hypothetical protein